MTESGIIVLCLLGVLAYLFFIRIYIAYRMAKNRYRDPLGWVLLSLFFSPLLAWIILLIVGDDTDARDKEERLDSYAREDERHYLRSSYQDNTH